MRNIFLFLSFIILTNCNTVTGTVEGTVRGVIKDVKTTIKREPYQTTEWLEDFAAEVVSVINEENGSYTAKVDPNNKKDLTIFSPTGETIEGFTLEPDMTVGGEGVNQIFNGTDPYAFPCSWDSRYSCDFDLKDEGTTTRCRTTEN